MSRKTKHSPKLTKRHKIRVRLAILGIIAAVVFISGGITYEHAWHTLLEFSLMMPLDKLADYIMFGGGE